MPTVTNNSGIKFYNLSDELELSMLFDENIKPKEHYPLVWKIGNKDVSFSDIESLYKLAVMRKEQFEERIIMRADRLKLGSDVTRIPTVEDKIIGLS